MPENELAMPENDTDLTFNAATGCRQDELETGLCPTARGEKESIQELWFVVY